MHATIEMFEIRKVSEAICCFLQTCIVVNLMLPIALHMWLWIIMYIPTNFMTLSLSVFELCWLSRKK